MVVKGNQDSAFSSTGEAGKSLAFSVNWNCLYICWFATCGGFKACATKELKLVISQVQKTQSLTLNIGVVYSLKIKCNFVQNKRYATDDMELDDAVHMAILMLKEG
nr:hypothetical protein CFP56_31897 [Quercus suber]